MYKAEKNSSIYLSLNSLGILSIPILIKRKIGLRVIN